VSAHVAILPCPLANKRDVFHIDIRNITELSVKGKERRLYAI